MCLSTALCCCAGACNLFCCTIPCKLSRATRLFYTFGLLIITVLAWALRNWGGDLPADWQKCNGECFQYMAVYRITFGFALYHAILCISMIGVTTSRFRGRFHNGWWFIKAPMLIGLVAASFFIPESFFTIWAYIAIVFGIIFLLVQTIMLLEFAYSFADKMLNNYEESHDPCWKIGLFIFTFISFAFFVAATVLLFVYFTGKPGCGLNVFFLSFNIALVILLCICAVLPRVQEAIPRSGLLQASIIGVYITYVIGSAISSEPNDETFSCSNTDSGSDTFSEILFYVGFVGTFFTVCLSAFTVGSDDEAMTVPTDKEDADDEKDRSKYNYSVFHLVFVLAAGYVAVLLTNWGIITGSTESGDFEIDRGFGAVWAKAATSWLVAAMYLWSLFAPVIFPNRDFGHGKFV